jgi:hypothetical protein
MSRIIKGQVFTLFALLTALVVTLAACGGGSSSTGGAATGSTVAGTVGNGVAAIHPSAHERPLLLAMAESLVQPAHADGAAGITVELLLNGAVVASQITDSSGRFQFSGLAPGQYSIRLSQNGEVLGQTTPMQVDAATKTEIELSLNGDVLSVEVEASGDEISGKVEDDSSSDDDSSDDISDDDSSDDDSSDDSLRRRQQRRLNPLVLVWIGGPERA